jgi:hypothetical protein
MPSGGDSHLQMRAVYFMKVSFFKSIQNTSPHVSKDVSHFLDRIKDGKSEKIISQLRFEPDKDKKKQIKLQLPVICFNGEFLRRSNNTVKKSSGLMILDFDNLQNPSLFKNQLKSDPCIFSAWISPSGDGVKALLRIHEVKDDKEFKQVFDQVKIKYHELDGSGKDIARACFESFDPEIYVNLNAEKFDFKFEETYDKIEFNLGTVTNIPLIDQDAISNRLMVWFKKHYNTTARNNSLFILASAFNDFGVQKITCQTYLNTFSQPDFGLIEIEKIIDSAYKKTSNFCTKFFEDRERKDRFSNMVLAGKSQNDIKNEFQDISEEKIEEEIQIIKKNIDVSIFWDRSKKGEIVIKPYLLKLYLESLNYYKFYPVDKSKPFIFITKRNNFINQVNEFNIKDELMNRLIESNNIDVFDVMASRTSIFTSQYLSMLETANVNLEKDGEHYAMIYYKNCAVKVFKDYIDILDYSDLEGFVWENQVINRDFVDSDHHDSMFRTFLWLISGKDVSKYNTFKSLIGYLLHSYKTSANNKAIILNDETVSEVPNGGSGKGIILNAIGHMKKLSLIDGKTFDFNKSFAYQTVQSDCQVLAYDDVKRNFEFERLFSQITEGLTLEYKNQGAIKLPVQDSPKIVITTNYTIKTTGGSFERRVFEVELSSYFGVHHTPLDEFGVMLFDGWDSQEWAKFDKLMINCLQYYLENGLVKSETKNLGLRKFINESCQEFFEFVEDGNIPQDERITKSDIYQKFKDENEDMKFLNKRLFNKWIKAYSVFKKLEYQDGNSNGVRWFVLSSGIELPINETNEPPF